MLKNDVGRQETRKANKSTAGVPSEDPHFISSDFSADSELEGQADKQTQQPQMHKCNGLT